VNNLVVVCIATAAVFMVIERLFPARQLEVVPSWWPRVILINAFYAGLVILGGYTWDNFFVQIHYFQFFENVSPLNAGLAGYFFLSFVYYWWHRFRHENQFLWRWMHQLHHTPIRIETITSLYKHPIEIVTNTFLTSTCCYVILGLNIQQTSWTLFFLATAEYCYHVNIRTPRWVGYFIQRPEMHRVHHQKGIHHYNYSDLPIWDMIFGTFSNPENQSEDCGLGIENEIKLLDLLMGVDLEKTTPRK
jgi:sterol desaturase/sphingolipid hydroxylase (fatty acid hydroxylase superfamily)